MLDALPKDLRCDKNELIGEILGDVFMYRYRQAADAHRKQKTPTKRSSFWMSFAAKLEPSASAISTILARIPAPKNLVAGWNEMDSPEFRDLDRVVDGKGFGSRGVRPSHWNARAELERTVEILRWALQAARTCEIEAIEKSRLKGQKPEHELLRSLQRRYRDATGKAAETPYYDAQKETSVGAFLDFVAPAVMELEDIDRGGVATRIKRLARYDSENTGLPATPKKRGRRPKNNANLLRQKVNSWE